MDLRCQSKIKFGVITSDYVEFVCRSRRCGKRAGVVVLHRFSIKTGELLQTKEFAEPKKGK